MEKETKQAWICAGVIMVLAFLTFLRYWWYKAEFELFLEDHGADFWRPLIRWIAFAAGCGYGVYFCVRSNSLEVADNFRAAAYAGLGAFCLFCAILNPSDGIIGGMAEIYRTGILGALCFLAGAAFATVVFCILPFPRFNNRSPSR